LVVYGVKDSRHAVASAETPERVDCRVLDGTVEIGQALLIGTGQVPVLPARVRARAGLESERLTHLGGASQVIVLEEGTGGSH
jgi:hypothetical protein